MALVTKNGLAVGRRAALITALGINLGVLVWTMTAALGAAALVRSSAVAFDTLKYLGAAYLLFLGLQTIWRSLRTGSLAQRPPLAGTRSHGTAAFRQGLLSNLLNPKLALFYTSLLPQFIPTGESALVHSLMLGCIFNLMGVVWLCSYAWFVAGLGDFLRPRSRCWLDRLTGTVLIGFGVRLATERR
jgi:threonine/homoserine/homoserine lactone efflux protein